MTDFRAFHDRAKEVRPEEPSKPSTYWVAVFDHTKKPTLAAGSDDFLWIKCHRKITVQTIKTQYHDRRDPLGGPIVLRLANDIVHDTMQMSELNRFGDNHIVLRALRPDNAPQFSSEFITRPPLQPVKNQVTAKTLSPAAPVAPKYTYQSRSLGPQSVENESKPYLGSAPESDMPYKSPYPIRVQTPLKRESSELANTDDVSGAVARTDDEEQPVLKNSGIKKMLSESSPEVLEAGVQRGMRILEKLRNPLTEKAQQSQDAAQWLQQIENLQKRAVKTKTVVGVVGNTGAGKSSVINAMLDEERLVPTNCMRACTAVVTEMSYNEAEDPQARYRAEIEFITVADWERELNILFEELVDGSGSISRECNNQDSEAGVAYARIRAVYPGKTKEDLAKSSVQRLMQDTAVRNLLGSSKEFAMGDSVQFYKSLQYFVDSKEKTTNGKEKNKRNKEKREMEYWPLIRVVKLYIKAPALSTGAVIVDLPGVHDSNAARAVVAESYMKQCTGLWIVAPINRAVDDKAAKSLLGESFKRQLKMDGGYSSVTFICSKTDDISITEAIDSLGLEDENGDLWEQMDSYEKDVKRLEKELRDLLDTKSVYKQTMDDVEEQIDLWDALKETVEDGKSAYAPLDNSNKSKKRKGGPGVESSKSKRPRRSSSDESQEDASDSENADIEPPSDAEQAEDSSEERGDPLNRDQIDTKLAELKSTKKEARRERLALDADVANKRQQIKQIGEENSRIKGVLSAKCIKGRNDYSKGAIQTDFASGIKELDQEVAMEDDEENFNPDVDVRDYDEVARSLPVFCVSSRAYQKLQGRLKKEAPVPGFETVEETEIPALQAHCRKLTEAGRASTCRRFLNQLGQLLNSMSLWAADDGTGPGLSEDQQMKEVQRMSGKLKKLENGLEKCVSDTIKELKEELGDNIYDKYDPAISSAEDNASNTASGWGAKVNRDNRAAGGYYWSTYKAICRRNGVYSNGQGPHDLNLQLAEPLIKQLASGWEKCFARRLPLVLTGYTKNSAALLKDFHRDADARARMNGIGITGLHVLQNQLHVYEAIFKDLGTTMVESINAQQREINREFTPVIAAAMLVAYETCTAESGPGSYSRMKYAMETHVDQSRTSMFRQSTAEVKARLTTMIRNVEEAMSNTADEAFLKMRRDYLAVLGGRALPQGEVMPKWERSMKHEVQRIVDSSEAIFGEVLGDEGRIEYDDTGDAKKQADDADDADDADVMAKEDAAIQEDAGPVKNEAASDDRQQINGKEGSLGGDAQTSSAEVLEANGNPGLVVDEEAQQEAQQEDHAKPVKGEVV